MLNNETREFFCSCSPLALIKKKGTLSYNNTKSVNVVEVLSKRTDENISIIIPI